MHCTLPATFRRRDVPPHLRPAPSPLPKPRPARRVAAASPTKDAASEAFSNFLNAFQDEERFDTFESDLKECDEVVTTISQNPQTANAEQVLNEILLQEAAVLMEGEEDAGPGGDAHAGLEDDGGGGDDDDGSAQETAQELAELAAQRSAMAAQKQAIAEQHKAKRAELAELQRLRVAEEERLDREQARAREKQEAATARAREQVVREQAEMEAAFAREAEELEAEIKAEKAAREALTSAALANEQQNLQTIQSCKQEIEAEHQLRRVAAAVTLQSHFRGRLARAVHRTLWAAEQERRRAAKKAAEQRRFAALAKEQRKIEAEAAKLEQERRALESQRERERRELEERRGAAAVVLQSRTRRWLAQRVVQRRRDLAARAAAATVLQAHTRGTLARRRHRREQEERQHQEAEARLQEAERLAAHHRAEAQRARAELAREQENARLEQALREERERQVQQAAAEEEARLRLEHEAADAAELLMIQDFAATTVQAGWRGFATRRRLMLEREVFGPAATMIQACWRGHYVRANLERIRAQALFQDDDDFDYDEEIDLADLDFDENEFDNDFEAVPPPPQAAPFAAPAVPAHEQLLGPPPKPPAGGLAPPTAGPGVKEAWGASHSNGPSPDLAAVTVEQARDIWSTTPTPDIMHGSVTPRPPSKQVIRIRDEWGFKDPRTAVLMAKRSKRWGNSKKRGKKAKTQQPLSQLLDMQKKNAGVGHQHSKYDRVVDQADAFDDGAAEGASRPGTRQGYHWSHEKHVVHRGLVSANGRRSTVKNQVVPLPSITPDVALRGRQQQQQQKQQVCVTLPQIDGGTSTAAVQHRYSLNPSSARSNR